MKKQIKEIVFRKDLYPRFEPDLKKIGEYSENVERLPPILINQDNILIDGWHRIKAHRQSGLDEIEVNVETTESEESLYLRSIELNSIHGLQLSYKDKKSIAVRLYDGGNTERLVKALSISDRTFRGWTERKRKEITKERDELIIELYLKCKTQEEIAKELDITDQTVANILKMAKMPNLDFGKNGNFAENTKTFQTAYIPKGKF